MDVQRAMVVRLETIDERINRAVFLVGLVVCFNSGDRSEYVVCDVLVEKELIKAMKMEPELFLIDYEREWISVEKPVFVKVFGGNNGVEELYLKFHFRGRRIIVIEKDCFARQDDCQTNCVS